jgi:hypothetical protein
MLSAFRPSERLSMISDEKLLDFFINYVLILIIIDDCLITTLQV